MQSHSTNDAEVKSAAREGCKLNFIENCKKAKHHASVILGAKDGEVIGLLDADMMCLGDLSSVELMDFDLAYTERPSGSDWKINTGVYFVRACERVRDFAMAWYSTALQMLADEEYHDYWRVHEKFGGIHQAALGSMLRHTEIKAVALPCRVWNCVSNTWRAADDTTKLVHIMGNLREWCLDRGTPTCYEEQRLVDRWKQFDSECQREGEL